MARLVREHDLGVVARDFEPATLAAALNALSPERVAGFKQAADAAAGVLCMERNRELVLDVVERAMRRG
jgi:hypothetical protein